MSLENLSKYINNKPNITGERLSAEEFYDKFCSHCGSLRCEGIGTVWFEGCEYKESLKKENETNE